MEQGIREAFVRRDRARKEQAERLWSAIGGLANASESRGEQLSQLQAQLDSIAESLDLLSENVIALEGRLDDIESAEGPMLAAHLEATDPHGDRAYADGLSKATP